MTGRMKGLKCCKGGSAAPEGCECIQDPPASVDLRPGLTCLSGVRRQSWNFSCLQMVVPPGQTCLLQYWLKWRTPLVGGAYIGRGGVGMVVVSMCIENGGCQKNDFQPQRIWKVMLEGKLYWNSRKQWVRLFYSNGVDQLLIHPGHVTP